jgi:hypothetical protein
MKLENQVCSLELSKKLKELGVKQESLFYWCGKELYGKTMLNFYIETNDYLFGCGATSGEPDIVPERIMKEDNEEIISAFSVAELGEMLPVYIEKDTRYAIKIEKYEQWLANDMEWETHKAKGCYQIRYVAITDRAKFQFNGELDTEANARAKMLIYLIENNLLSNSKKK